MDKELYLKLIDLREDIQNAGFMNRLKKDNRRLRVCNDEVIHSIVNLMPENVDDFKKIRGVGDTFVKKYAQRFLTVINEHVQSAYSYSRTNKKELEILQKLNNKLVNINQKNRLLYTNRLTKRTGLDLTTVKQTERIIDAFVSEKTKSFVIAKVKDKNDELYRSIKSLYRQTETVRIEKGQEILYLAYPYVEGRLFTDFKIKAPLLLFPARIDFVNHEYRLSFDNSRDILYNSTLILANNKFNNKNEVIDDDVVEEINKEQFIEDALCYFSQHKVLIANDEMKRMEPFLETTNASFPNIERLRLKGYCVLGAFPTYSNAIQKDYNEIVDNKVISHLVRELFIGMESPMIQNKEIQKDPDETKIFYINPMNYSQEKILDYMDEKDAVVIQGPPGTGKSQTITSLISQAVLKDKKVLVISEKKTALDVIYNRLDKISNFVLYIDDPNNKQHFYQQLKDLLELDDEPVTNENKIMAKSLEINAELKKLQELENCLDSKTKLQASLRELYQHSQPLDFTDLEIKRLFKEVKHRKKKVVFTLEQLLTLRKIFKKKDLVDNLITYKESVKFQKIFKFFKQNINETDLHLETKDYYEIPFYINLYQQFGWMTKLRLNSKNKELLNTIKSLLLKLGGKQRKQLKQHLYSDVHFFMEAVKYYPKFQFNKNVYDSLTTAERNYFEYCFYLSKRLKLDFSKVNESLMDVFTTVEITDAEQKHHNILITTERFDDLHEKMTHLMEEKEKLTFECVYNLLQKKIKTVFSEHSKRLNELRRKCESKRKWSIPKLMNEFRLELFNSVYVWLLTPEGVSELLPMKESLFDLIIFDEASQMFIENAIPILYRGTQTVIAGDSHQLRPSKFGLGRIDQDDLDYDEYSGVLEEESLLDLAKHRYHEAMLTYHYRSKYEELIAFSNYAFYDGKLHVCPNISLKNDKPIERIKVNGHWIHRQNEVEADEIITLLKKIFIERKGETIGIITFNATQKNLIQDKIDQECLYNQEFYQAIANEKLREPKDQLFVKNIENVQGDERDIIIFSIGYAPNEHNRIVRQFGWLNNDGGENRLNVAVSRAKKKIYVVTSIEPFELQVEDLKNKGPKLLKDYLEYVKAISENDKEMTKQILYRLSENIPTNEVNRELSAFEKSVYNALVERGYQVEQHIGTGVHKINLAVKDQKTKKYTLGIELNTCDSPSLPIKERDYHRQKYLEVNGWSIYRLWENDWWRDPEREIEKIISKISKKN